MGGKGRRKRICARGLAVCLTGLAGGRLDAQAVPPQAPLSAVQQALPSREEVTPPVPVPAARPTVSVDARQAIAQPDCPFDASPLKLTLRRVTLTRPDGTPLAPEIARSLSRLEPPTGEQRLRVICELRDQANALLRDDGWVASIQVPPQSITAGELKLVVVTARITEVRVRGEPGPYRRLLERRVAQLKALDPLNQREAERLLLLAGDVPGLEVQLSLRPAGTKPGDVIGDLSIAFRRFSVAANVQNYNSRSLGRTTGYARAELYGLTGHADLTYLGASATSDFRKQLVVQAGELFGLGAGTTLGGRFTYAWSRPDLGALDLRTDTLIWGLDLVRPLVRSVNANARAALGFDYVDQRTDVGAGSAAVPLNLDKTRTVFARLSGDLLRRRAAGDVGLSLRGGVEVRKGLGIFDATRTQDPLATVLPSRIEGDARALVIRGDADAVVGFGRFLSAAGSVRGQWADRPLLNYDEFSIGNLTIGRGYDPGSNSGDRAIGLHGELRVAPPVLRTVSPQLYGFYDFVALTNLDTYSTEVDRRLRSVGGGLRMVFANRLAAEIGYAHPMDRALLIDKAPPPDRVLLSLIVQVRGKARR